MANKQQEMVPLKDFAHEVGISYGTALRNAKLSDSPFKVQIVMKCKLRRYYVLRKDVDAYKKIRGIK